MNTADERIPYEKPVLKAVNLAADEVLGSGCKTESTTTELEASGPGCEDSTCFQNGT
jgi:hypothetical protein